MNIGLVRWDCGCIGFLPNICLQSCESGNLHLVKRHDLARRKHVPVDSATQEYICGCINKQFYDANEYQKIRDILDI